MNTVFLKLISAISIAGVIREAGEIIEVPEYEARSLLHREVAEVATENDEPAEAAPDAEQPAEETPAANDEPAEAAPEDKQKKK